MNTAAAVLLRPFLTLLLFVVVVIPIEMFLARVWPNSRLKQVLFDRTLQERDPDTYLFWAVILMAGLAVFLFLLFYLFAK